MGSLQKEKNFFRSISRNIISLVEREFRKQRVFPKGTEAFNLQTTLDTQVEKMILENLEKQFPGDAVLAEETKSDENIMQKGRLWIIDPICGTIKMTRGMTGFCTSVALGLDRKIIAGCVIDHSRKEYIWSTGEKKIFVGKTEVIPKRYPQTMVEVNLAALSYWDASIRKSMQNFMSQVLLEESLMVKSSATALDFAYVALGRVDAYVSPYHHIWDVPAANFLIEQAGGIVTDIEGKPWTLDKTSTLAALDKKLHAKLLRLLK